MSGGLCGIIVVLTKNVMLLLLLGLILCHVVIAMASIFVFILSRYWGPFLAVFRETLLGTSNPL